MVATEDVTVGYCGAATPTVGAVTIEPKYDTPKRASVQVQAVDYPIYPIYPDHSACACRSSVTQPEQTCPLNDGCAEKFAINFPVSSVKRTSCCSHSRGRIAHTCAERNRASCAYHVNEHDAFRSLARQKVAVEDGGQAHLQQNCFRPSHRSNRSPQCWHQKTCRRSCRPWNRAGRPTQSPSSRLAHQA